MLDPAPRVSEIQEALPPSFHTTDTDWEKFAHAHTLASTKLTFIPAKQLLSSNRSPRETAATGSEKPPPLTSLCLRRGWRLGAGSRSDG